MAEFYTRWSLFMPAGYDEKRHGALHFLFMMGLN